MTSMILSFISVNSFEQHHEASLNGQSRYGTSLTVHSCQDSLEMYHQQVLYNWTSCVTLTFLYLQNGQV